jgi:predicted CXXCH cytochrome family protein
MNTASLGAPYRLRRAIILLLTGSGILLVGSPLQAQTRGRVDYCVVCHTQLEGTLASPVKASHGDVHASAALSCADCHGGDPSINDAEAAMSAARGFVGVPTHQQTPAFCGRCHSDAAYMKRFNPAQRVDQQAEFATSNHGKRLAAGDANVATCTKCHGSHGIRRANDPASPVHPLNVAKTCGSCHASEGMMASYGIGANQVAEYAKSAHATAMVRNRDLSAPTCNDCHGNHGATPPGVASVSHVCGTCHVRQEELFARSAHREPYEAMGQAACLACHSNHATAAATDELLGTGDKSTCVQCHSEGDNGFKVAAALRAGIDRLAGQIDGAGAILNRASEAGMEVSRPQFELKDAQDRLINARVMVHAVSVDDLDTVLAAGAKIAASAHSSGLKALDELDFRRTGLIISLAVILLAAGLIYLKVRQIEKRQRREAMSTA